MELGGLKRGELRHRVKESARVSCWLRPRSLVFIPRVESWASPVLMLRDRLGVSVCLNDYGSQLMSVIASLQRSCCGL